MRSRSSTAGWVSAPAKTSLRSPPPRWGGTSYRSRLPRVRPATRTSTGSWTPNTLFPALFPTARFGRGGLIRNLVGGQLEIVAGVLGSVPRSGHRGGVGRRSYPHVGLCPERVIARPPTQTALRAPGATATTPAKVP